MHGDASILIFNHCFSVPQQWCDHCKYAWPLIWAYQLTNKVFSTSIINYFHSSEHVIETFAILKHVMARLASMSPSPPAPLSFVGDCTTWSKTASNDATLHITSKPDRSKKTLLQRNTADYVHIILFPTSLLAANALISRCAGPEQRIHIWPTLHCAIVAKWLNG